MIFVVKYFIKLLIVFIFAKQCSAKCSPALSGGGSSLLQLSNDLLNVQQAENQCSSLGGRLVINTDKEVNEALTEMIMGLTPIDLTTDLLIKVFIGAKWFSNKWLWSDGIPANFIPLNSAICAQKVLDYSPEGVNIKTMYCNETAYYACEVEFSASIDTGPCNATYALISWEMDQFDNFFADTTQNITVRNIEVQAEAKNEFSVRTFLLSDGQGWLSELKPRTYYNIKVMAKFTGCNDFTVQTSLNLTTGVGIPEDTTNAIVSISSPCTVQLTSNQVEGFSYKLIATSESATTSGTREGVSTLSSLQVDTSAHEKGSFINITLQVFSCEGQSNPIQVKGQCTHSLVIMTTTETNSTATTVETTPANGTGDANLTDINIQSGEDESEIIKIPNGTNNDKYVLFAIIGGAGGVVLLLGGVAALLCYRTKRPSNARKTSRGKQPTDIQGLESAEERMQADAKKTKEKGSRKVKADKQSKNPDKTSKHPDKKSQSRKDPRNPDEKSRKKDRPSRSPKS